MKNMTREQIITKGKTYDRIQNEGGEGYNPYWSELERREIEESRKRAAMPKTKKEQIDVLHDKIRVECGSVAREWSGDEVDKKHAAYYSEIKKLRAEINAEFATVWTPEETTARRIVWNDFVRANLADGPMTPDKYRMVHNKTTELGWGLDDLKRAIKLHNLGAPK